MPDIYIGNAELGRKVLDRIDAEPGCFNMSIWGLTSNRTQCGSVACLAGHTMLACGYDLLGDDFIRPDGAIVIRMAHEAETLLGMVQDLDAYDVFYDHHHGLDRFRKAVEAAEGRMP